MLKKDRIGQNGYLKPVTKVAGLVTCRFIAASPGWSRDSNPPYKVEQEEEVDEDDLLPGGRGYGGFFDLEQQNGTNCLEKKQISCGIQDIKSMLL